MLHRIHESFDTGTTTFFGGALLHVATIKIDFGLSQAIGIVTLTIGLCKLVEIFTGKKVHTFFKRKK